MNQTLRCRSARTFEAWLRKNHAASEGVWLEIAKPGAPEATISYAEAVEIALCYGWIDGQKKARDAECWLQRFTPRRPRSLWSKANRARAEGLVAAGRMHASGQAEIDRARADGRWDAAYDGPRTAAVPLAPMLLWQPVAGGSTYLTQFLRLRTANAMLGDVATQNSTKALRAALEAGETLEIAGYDLTPDLARAIDSLPAPDAMVPPVSAHWFDVLGAPGQTPGPAAARVKAAWEAQGTPLHVHTVTGSPFWATTAVSTCPALLDATARVLEENVHAV